METKTQKSPAPAGPLPSPAVPYDVVYSFRISRCASGPFKNLWQLKVKTPDYSELVEVIDADMLTTVIDRIRFIFEQDGL